MTVVIATMQVIVETQLLWQPQEVLREKQRQQEEAMEEEVVVVGEVGWAVLAVEVIQVTAKTISHRLPHKSLFSQRQ